MAHYIDFWIYYLFEGTTNTQVTVSGNFNIFLTEASIDIELTESLFTAIDVVIDVSNYKDWKLQGCWVIKVLVNPL